MTPEGKVSFRVKMHARGDASDKRTYRKVDKRHEHRSVMESILGRSLSSDEIVHHKDNNPRNNDPTNLEVMTRSAHAKLHNTKTVK